MDEHFEKQTQNAMAVIKELKLEDFIKNFDGKDGFMWSSDSRVNQIGNKLIDDGHTGASFAFTLRECQRRLRKESESIEPKNEDGIKLVGETNYNKMDDNNKKAVDIMASQGMDKAVEHMFLHPETGEPMDYATMRSFYG
tara:strand:+ start:27 stop:446 length:420 start_codon:yes stop_codon:yes gene_type:complete